MFNTWSEIGATTASYGWSNGDGWSHTDGDYAQLAMATLSGIAELTGSQAAADAYHALLADNAPFVSDSDFSRDPTFAIVAPGEDNAPVFQIPAPSVPIVTNPVETPADNGSDSPQPACRRTAGTPLRWSMFRVTTGRAQPGGPRDAEDRACGAAGRRCLAGDPMPPSRWTGMRSIVERWCRVATRWS
ncbi:hypothetical protein ACFQU7_09540 [Pseudoroseomonas wenyumeiae]